jgi:hypothetical protein
MKRHLLEQAAMFIPPMSALQRIPDSGRTARHVRKPAQIATSRMQAYRKKSRPKAALNSNLMIEDQAAINAGFELRR